MLKDRRVLRAVSLILAVSIWWLVISGQETTTEITIGVNLIKTPAGRVASSSNKTVTVLVKGSARLMDSLKAGDLSLGVDVSSFPIGSSHRRFINTDVKSPLGIEVVNIEPAEAIITIDEIITKKVAITPDLIGKPEEGYVVDSVSVKPNEINVTGGREQLKDVSSIITHPINISERLESFKVNTNLIDFDFLQVDEKMVEVYVRIKQDVVNEKFENVPVECRGLPSKFKLASELILTEVVVNARKDILNNFYEKVHFFVNCSDINKVGRVYKPVAYESNLELSVLGLKPDSVRIEVEKR